MMLTRLIPIINWRASMGAMASTWTAQTLEALSGGGHRNGVARRAVVELLGRQDCCLTAQEIFDRLRAEGRQVGIASVYRVLDLLGEKGLVQRIDFGAGTARYERVLASGEHHHHLVCDGLRQGRGVRGRGARDGAAQGRGPNGLLDRRPRRRPPRRLPRLRLAAASEPRPGLGGSSNGV